MSFTAQGGITVCGSPPTGAGICNYQSTPRYDEMIAYSKHKTQTALHSYCQESSHYLRRSENGIMTTTYLKLVPLFVPVTLFKRKNFDLHVLQLCYDSEKCGALKACNVRVGFVWYFLQHVIIVQKSLISSVLPSGITNEIMKKTSHYFFTAPSLVLTSQVFYTNIISGLFWPILIDRLVSPS